MRTKLTWRLFNFIILVLISWCYFAFGNYLQDRYIYDDHNLLLVLIILIIVI